MKTHRMYDVFGFMCKTQRCWGLMLSCSNGEDFKNSPLEVSKAIHPKPRFGGEPLGTNTAFDLATGDQVWLTFETEQEAREYFDWTVGDDVLPS